METIYGAIAGDTTPEIDTENIAAAVYAPASRPTFHVVTDEDELAEMLALPLAQWRTLSQYAHVLPGMQAEAAELVRSIVGEAG